MSDYILGRECYLNSLPHFNEVINIDLADIPEICKAFITFKSKENIKRCCQSHSSELYLREPHLCEHSSG
ncbi:MAG: hypothetical protein Kow0049_20070 [Stanieria sp.]